MARDNKALRLRSIADKLESIASALKADLDQNALFPNEREDLGGYAFADDDVNVALTDAAASVSSHELMQMADQARAIYRGRRLRAQILGDDGLFGEPAWDLLLDLFIAEVVAAWADPAVFSDGRWHFPDAARRTIHYQAGGAFFETGRAFECADA